MRTRTTLATLTMAVLALGGTTAIRAESWYENTFFNIHFDHHTHPGQKELGAGSIPENIAAFLKRTKPDFVQYHAKGHPGYATYKTTAGTPNPNMKRDVVRVWRDVTRSLDMKFTVYYSGGVDSLIAQKHPDWTRVQADGQPQGNIAGPTPSLCYNSPYVEKVVLPMVRELLEGYDVDGFWFDGENWSVLPCWCKYCKAAFEKETKKKLPTRGDESHFPLFLEFQRNSFVRYLEKVAAVVHEKPGCLFATNWGFTMRQPDAVPPFIDWLSGDIPPTHGLEQASLEARFLSTRGKPFDLMTFDQGYQWNQNPPRPKLPVQLMQEAAVVIANGGRFFLWDNPREDGSLSSSAAETIAKVGDFVRRRQNWTHRTRSVPDIAILHSKSHFYSHGSGLFDYGPVLDPVRGAHAALTELHAHTDIITEETLVADAGRYHTVVVPEQINLPDNVISALVAFVENGGQLLVTGPVTNAGLAKLCGIYTENQPVMQTGYATLSPYGPWIYQPIYHIRTDGSTIITYVSLSDDPSRPMKKAGLIYLFQPKRGRVVYVATDIFREFKIRRHPYLRNLIGKALDTLTTKRRLRLDAPPVVETSLRTKDGHLIVNLVNRSAGQDTSDERYFIESVPPLFNITVDLELPARPQDVFLYPGNEKPEWEYNAGRLKVRVRKLDIHTAVVIKP